MSEATGPLKGLKVFDLTRVLAGPTCVQMLADLGADVIKIEKPGTGDDTRGFAPPFMPGTKESAYFVGVNRNKRSLTLDIAQPEGQALALELIAQSDILAENFKVGALARYGLGYAQLKKRFPGLIYCSITGFGQTGPYAARPGYDSLIQAMGGVMSLTGEPDGAPQKVGVPLADLFAGLYGCIGILAALRHREATGRGQQIDIGMLDAHVAWLANQGMNYLATRENPARLGDAAPLPPAPAPPRRAHRGGAARAAGHGRRRDRRAASQGDRLSGRRGEGSAPSAENGRQLCCRRDGRRHAPAGACRAKKTCRHFPVDKSAGAIAPQHKRNYRLSLPIETVHRQAPDRRVAGLVTKLREQAQRCSRLAKSIYNPEAAADLEAYARQLQERPQELEAKPVPEPPAAP